MTGLGGALGAIARVALGKAWSITLLGVPCYILFVNILGCFIIGLLSELMSLYWTASDNTRYFLISGFLGGFTTFSSFALEFGLLFEKQEYRAAMLYAISSVVLGIIAFFIGAKIIRFFSVSLS